MATAVAGELSPLYGRGRPPRAFSKNASNRDAAACANISANTPRRPLFYMALMQGLRTMQGATRCIPCASVAWLTTPHRRGIHVGAIVPTVEHARAGVCFHMPCFSVW